MMLVLDDAAAQALIERVLAPDQDAALVVFRMPTLDVPVGIKDRSNRHCDCMHQVELFPDSQMNPKHDPGGKTRLKVNVDVKSSVIFGGPQDCYRYRLVRTWDGSKPHAMWVMMNPSYADHEVNDRTVAKCERLARAWGYGGIYVGNTFAYRATDKKCLRLIADPVGPDNDKHLLAMAKKAAVVIFAYGQPGHRTLLSRGLAVAQLLKSNGIKPHVLKLSKDGIPSHPLYLLETLRPVLWQL